MTTNMPQKGRGVKRHIKVELKKGVRLNVQCSTNTSLHGCGCWKERSWRRRNMQLDEQLADSYALHRRSMLSKAHLRALQIIVPRMPAAYCTFLIWQSI